MRNIIVVEYDPNWKNDFEKAKSFYEGLLYELDIRVEHVGSTSVEGLWAKPILDIDIIVSNDDDSKRAIELLTQVGYRHLGDMGLEGREAFDYDKESDHIQWMRHNLYVIMDGCENLVNHLILRDTLRANNALMEAYGSLKRDLAQKHPHDIDSYLDGKTDFILSILKDNGMQDASIERIESINKLKK